MSAVRDDDLLVSTAEFLSHLWVAGPHALCVDIGNGFEYVRHYDDPAAFAAAALDVDGHVWWGVNPTPGAVSRGTIDDVDQAGVLFCDLDWAEGEHKGSGLPSEVDVRSVVAAFPIRPTAIVETGGGMHLYWRLSEPVPLDEWERGQELVRLALTAEGLHVEGTDAARVLRVPGTWNHKTDPARLTVVSSWLPRVDSSLAPTVALFEKRFGHLVAAEEDESETIWSSMPRSKSGPISEFNATHSVADELVAAGWRRVSKRGWWSRPGRGEDLGQSARVRSDSRGEILMVFSSAPELDVLRRIGKPTKNRGIVMVTAFDLWAVRCHGGDVAAALNELRGGPPPHVDPETGEIAVRINLPDEFWSARPWLFHIRQAAWSAMVSPDAVLGAFLARYAATIPPDYEIPKIVVSKATFDHLSVLVGASSSGKSGAEANASELFPDVYESIIVWDFPCPSGEGLVEAFFDMVEFEDDGKKKREKRKTKQAVHFVVDEAMALIEQTNRQGTTIASVLCSAWAGQTLGQGNASLERKRIVPKRSGRVSGLMGIQADLGWRLLDDKLVRQGLTGRLLFFAADDPKIPHRTEKPVWPGPLPVTPPPVVILGRTLRYADEIVHEVQDARWEVQTRKRTESVVEGHERLARLKVAGMFALIDGRGDVTVDDWVLAGMVVATSRALRDQMAREGSRQRADIDRQRGVSDGRRALAAEEIKERQAVAQLTESIIRRVRSFGDEGVAVGKLRKLTTATTTRQRFPAALEQAETRGAVVTRGDRVFPASNAEGGGRVEASTPPHSEPEHEDTHASPLPGGLWGDSTDSDEGGGWKPSTPSTPSTPSEPPAPRPRPNPIRIDPDMHKKETP